MLRWIDIIKLANHGNPPPFKKLQKTAEEAQNAGRKYINLAGSLLNK